MAQLVFPRAQVWGDVASVGRTDAAYARRFFAQHRDRGSAIGAPLTDMIWGGGRLLNAWPANPDEKEYNTVRDSSVPTLLIGGNLDFATPPQNATRELLPHLSNGHQVVLRDMGHSDDFWALQPAAADRLINTYLDSGRVDTSLYKRNTVDFTPSTGHDRIAKIVLAVLLSLAGLTVLSLLWMPIRVWRRGAYGRKASVAIRSVYALVLGLGGWFAGVLVAMTALPTVPLTDEVLALVSIGIPVGLAIALASSTGLARLVATLVGAVAGAWLGLHVSDGMFAPLLAVVAATAAANLVVIALDIARESATAPAPRAVTQPSA
jgi:hypothetical protein